MNQQQASRLIHACHVLFGSDIAANPDFLHYIQLSGVKSAFRRRALSTHPDTQQSDDDRMFIEIKHAYDLLYDFVANREVSPGPTESAGEKHSETGPASQDDGNDSHQRSRRKRNGKRRQSKDGSFYFGGNVPRTQLRLAEFLYYSGVISWHNLIEAIVWQRKQRPVFGAIAADWAWITLAGASDLLYRRKPGERIGEAAIRLHTLNHTQVEVILSHQKRLQKPIGHFFVNRGHLTWNQLVRLLNENKLHNARHTRTDYQESRAQGHQ